ncbi:vacuolar membrane-associated protein iml1 [Lambiella insularis]|nr:vacuolar membrane-associated protein iml1 [Lambiella insularis]
MSSSALPTRGHSGQQGSRLRHANSRDEGGSDPLKREYSTSPRSNVFAQAATDLHVSLVCTLGIHDEAFSKEEVLVNLTLFDPGSLAVGTPIRMTALEADSPRRSFKHYGARGSSADQKERVFAKTEPKSPQQACYLFKANHSSPETVSKHPNLEVSISQHIASALGFKHRDQVLLASVKESDCVASHVEISFRDAYLTRADMWRLVLSELADKSMYKGQRLMFIGSIKAQIRRIYIAGRKVQSAFFGSSTKPIFRSESARYVLFIQMSKEMWDFDTDGTGEIMFHKVINGFLPELFRRWEDARVRHLVSVILFTRLEYNQRLPLHHSASINDASLQDFRENHLTHRDFYRVLVSDMASGQWTAILTQLKKEFKVFLRDVSLHVVPLSEMASQDEPGMPRQVHEIIAGQPTAATCGNILEAISLATSQFSSDYIDRDLVRTGLSIVIITPGTGVFEVDYALLTRTTDTLIENGVGIDLVCLSPMPLHSVPLFKYRHEEAVQSLEKLNDNIVTDTETDDGGISGKSGASPIRYAVPHWIDVSFWAVMPSAGSIALAEKGSLSQEKLDPFKQSSFIPRVRMYEVQMMGIMGNELGSISIPYLLGPSKYSSASSLRNQINCGPRENFSFSNDQKKSNQAPETYPKSSYASISSISANNSANLAGLSKNHASFFEWLDEHDECLFSHPRDLNTTLRPQRITPLIRSGIEQPRKATIESTSSGEPRETPTSRTSGVTIPISQVSKRTNLSRHISFGLRGFAGGALKAIPVTEVSIHNAQSASLLSESLRQQRPPPRSTPLVAEDEDVEKSSLYIPASDSVPTSLPDLPRSGLEQGTRPIAIKTSLDTPTRRAGEVPLRSNLRSGQQPESEDKSTDTVALEDKIVQHADSLSPESAMRPWLTVLNPSNPNSVTGNPTRRLGRWHHVFPRPIQASVIKWKSLISPASVPLTTEEFPSQDQLHTEYIESEYKLSAAKENEMSEDGEPNEWLMRELICARLSHGFQVVVGSRILQAMQEVSAADNGFFNNINFGLEGAILFMSRGGIIHRLNVISDGVVHVKEFVRRSMVSSMSKARHGSPVSYLHSVRTSLSDKYALRKATIATSEGRYDWQRLDLFIAGHEEQHAKRYPDPLQFWRARFVLIPKERPFANKKTPHASSEDNEEEIRLEGIRKLTQLWQKNRYFSPDERRFQSTLRTRKDPNPLDIIYRTRNPSAIVAAELNSTLLAENDGTDIKPSQLLPDTELFERHNLNLTSISSIIQSDRGVKMMDRRWHWRLHYNCFIGMELTTWLLNNFKDIDSREEAVELGNELMRAGLFQHVERRHNFRDGNFFYQIANDYRRPRPDTKTSWFGSRKSDQSVPSTPITEVVKSSPVGRRSRSSSIDGERSEDESLTPHGKQMLGVALSKRLVYDVDPRRRSYRQELITLHYDRISSADDCYHLRIDWMNVTPKLIEDAIVQWATLAERNGLRLVELPIGEASRINEFHPFRAPYTVSLAKPPPNRQPQSYFDATSLSPKLGSNWPYHTAILKKFNFVLDLEAAKDFPPSVDVTYSWGKPDYQYPQFISREGVLLAQITDSGDFLLLANRLYTNRSAATKETNKASTNNAEDLPNNKTHRSPIRAAKSPSASPALRATPDVGLGLASSESIAPETIAYELEAFCKDAAALESFYEEVLQKRAVSGPATPVMESSISALGPPPTFSLRDPSPTTRSDALGEKRRSRADKAAIDTA